MKKTRPVIATAIITLLTFGAIVYTSCTKDRCKNVMCQNGGTCSNGYCSCPSGFQGDHCETGVTTTIQYWNHGYTDIILTLNNVAYTVPAGRSKGFTGAYGDSLKGNAYTGGRYGDQITWDSIATPFPQSETTTVDLHIPPNYFFLFVNNQSDTTLREFQINSNSEEVIFTPPLAHPSFTAIGYFHATSTSNVVIIATNSAQIWADTLNLPLTQDQAYTSTVN